MKSIKYLEMIKTKFEFKSDRQLALYLGMGTTTISQYMSGKRIMDDEACLAVALALEIGPLEVIGAACIDRADKTGQKSLWEVFMNKTAQAASVVLAVGAVAIFLTPTPSEAAPVLNGNVERTLHYVKCNMFEKKPDK